MKKRIMALLASLVLAAVSVTGCGAGTDSKAAGAGELNLFVWTEYLPDSVVEKFQKETGIKVNVSTYSSNEDMLAKVKSETAGAYDVLNPSDYMVAQLISQDMLRELDFDKLPNFSHIGESYKNPAYDPGNKYSVPFDLIGEQVQIRLTKNTVEVFFKGDRVASHQRIATFQTQPVVKPEHMPEKHRMYLRYNADDFRAWAKTVGDSTETVVDHFLKSGSSPEQGYKNCVTLMKLGEKNGKEKLEYACERMLELSSVPSIRTIAVILKNGKEPERKTTSPADSEKYGITRGAAYFNKGGDRNA